MKKIAMFDTKPYDIEGFEKYNGKDFDIKFFDMRLTPDTVMLAKGFDGVICFVNDEINKTVLDALYEYGINIIAMRCAGYNNVDIKEAYNKVHIARVPAYSPHSVAEHAMALLLCSVRRIHKSYIRTKDFNFSLSGLRGINLNGKTMGIVGMGKIGRVFADICRGFGMEILAYDLKPDKNLPFEFVSLDEIFEKSHFISLHCPLTEDNRYLINRESIEKMRDGVIIINTSRGALIDTDDLILGIKERKIGAACLDVYEEEHDIFFEDKSGHILDDDTLARLLSMPNVILTSHQGFMTEEALSSIAKTTVQNLKDYFFTKTLENEICYRCGKEGVCYKKREGKCF